MNRKVFFVVAMAQGYTDSVYAHILRVLGRDDNSHMELLTIPGGVNFPSKRK